ncbi:activating signal cointegrator 1 complex subunit 2 homolog [Argonauta hians]
MLLQRKHSQSVVDYTFSAMPRNAFKAPKTKRSPAKPEPEGYTSVAKKRRTKDDFYTFCTIVLSYTQYESLKREELRQQNNISPVGSGGSAADSYSSDSTASLSSGSLQESIPESLQEALPIDRVQDSISSANSGTTTTTTVANCRLTDRLTHPQLPKQQQFVKQQQQQSPKHSMFVKQQQQQQHVKQQQQQHSKLQLLKQQQSQQQQHIKPLVQPKQQQQAVARQLTKQQNQAPPAPPLVQATLLPPLSSVPPAQHNSNRLDGFYHRNNNVEADLSSMSTPSSLSSSLSSSSSSSTSLSSSSSSSSSTTPSHQQYSPHQKQKLQQQQQQKALVEDMKVKHLENVQLEKREECSPCEHHLKTRIKQEEKPCVDDLKSSMINHTTTTTTTSTTNPVTIKVEKDDDDEFAAVLEEKVASSHHHHHRHHHHHHHHHFPKMDLHQSTSDSHNESCGESVHSNCSSADAIESDDESWDLITCHCLKPYAGRPMIECSECSTWIHLSCAKIRKSNIPETFVCQQCREAKFTTRKSNRIRTESKRISI